MIYALAHHALDSQSRSIVTGLEKTSVTKKAKKKDGIDLATAMEAVTSHIPAEVVGMYLFLLGIFSPTAEGKWIIFGVCLALIPILAWLSHKALVRRTPPPEGTSFGNRRRVGLVLLPSIAFCAWTAAMPETPFLAIHEQATIIGAGAIMILAIILPKIGEAFDIPTFA